jgi:hypothetical protein
MKSKKILNQKELKKLGSNSKLNIAIQEINLNPELELIKVYGLRLIYKHKVCGYINNKLCYQFLKNKTICGNRKCVFEHTKKTNLERYGSENVFQNEQIKNKIKINTV